MNIESQENDCEQQNQTYEYNNRVLARQFTVEKYIAKRNGNDRGHNRYQIQHKGAFAYRSIIDCIFRENSGY